MKNKNLQNVIWNTSGTITYYFCCWVITVLVVKLASYEAAGYLSLAISTSSSFSAISLWSMRNYQVSDYRREFSDNVYFGSRIVTCAAALILCVAISAFRNSAYQTVCIAAFMLLRVGEGFADVLHGIDQRNDRYDLIGISYLVRGGLIVIPFAVGCIITDRLPIVLTVISLLGVCFVAFFDWRKTSAYIQRGSFFQWRPIGHLLWQCLPLALFTFLLSLENLIPKDTLSRLYGEEQLGIYSTLASPAVFIQVFAAVVFNPFIPMFSELYANQKYTIFHKNLRRVYLLLALAAILFVAGGQLVGQFGLSLLFGDFILPYCYLLIPIILSTILLGAISILCAILILLRKIRALIIGITADFLIGLLLTPYFVRQHQMNGVSLVQIITYSLLVCYMICVCERTLSSDSKNAAANP